MADDGPIGLRDALALVAVGGFAGSVLRFAIASALPGLPGTLVVNVLGSLALGFLVHEVELSGSLAGRTRVVVGTGFLSSFTTYSTFAVETARAPGLLPAGNVLATYGLGIGAALLGYTLARRVTGGEGS